MIPHDLDISTVPDLAQLEAIYPALEIILRLLDHRYPCLEEENAPGDPLDLALARELARKTRALGSIIRRYNAAIVASARRRAHDDMPF
jgi:hypothetical protein